MNQNVEVIRQPTAGIWTEIATEKQIAVQRESQDARAVFPIAVKANIGVAGLSRSAGCKALAASQTLTDAPVVAALRAAGAVVVGMTNMHELAFGITSNNASYGPVGLPGHPSRGAGGSSGGSAAAVAEGTVDIALGTDTGDSVSIPASHCGIFGFRRTTGRWPTAGTIGLSWTRDTPGVFTRTIEQAAQIDTGITGERSTSKPVDTLRLGVPHQFLDQLDPHTAAACHRALKILENYNHAEIVEIDYEPILALTGPAEMPTVLWEARRLLSSVAADAFQTNPEDGFAQLAHAVASPDVAALLQDQCERPVTAASYRQAQQDVALARAAYSELLIKQNLDGLISPATPAPAPPIDTIDLVPHVGQDESAFHLHTRHTGQGTMLAAPMVTLPLAVAEHELPVGLTVQGSRFGDRRLLDIARQLQTLVGT